MATLLEIDSSPLANSISRELTREFVANWKAAHPKGRVIIRDLAAHPAKPVDQDYILAMFTPEPALKPEQKALLAHSDECLAELQEADEWVIGVAMHNFTVPAVIKLWIDQIVRLGKTFAHGENGAEGLLTGKKATVLLAAGAVYTQGSPFASYNFVEPYLRTVFGFIGVKDVTFVTAGGTSQLRNGTIDRGQFLAPFLETVRNIAV